MLSPAVDDMNFTVNGQPSATACAKRKHIAREMAAEIVLGTLGMDGAA